MKNSATEKLVVDLWLGSSRADPPASLLPPTLPAELQATGDTVPLLVLDTHARIVRANPVFQELSGRSQAQLAGRELASFTTLQKAAVDDFPTLWAGLLDGLPATVEISRLDSRGESRWYQATYTPVRNTLGTVEQIVELSIDITARVSRARDAHAQIDAIHATSAIVEFSPDGIIVQANPRFLELTGYAADELIGQHHRLLVPPERLEGDDYARFWQQLTQGQHQSAVYNHHGKNGRELWLSATYAPVHDDHGRIRRVMLYCIDVTAERLRQIEYQWHIAALHKSHCVMTFDRYGVVVDANAAMLDALGYAIDQVQGRHHRMFVDPSYAHSAEYAAFWRALESGQYQAGQFRRIGKDGREIWLQANYSPVFDLGGQLIKVVKYASVITDEKRRQAEHQGQIAAIHKAQCVIAFDLDGTIVDANDNFLDAMGYRLSEVRGRHHRMFVSDRTAASAEYQTFWAALSRGEYQSGEFKRHGRDGREVWLLATYNPIFDSSGRPIRVVKYATDVTAQKLQQADLQGQIAAIHRSQGVVTFATSGVILDANQNFLDTFGYTFDELAGRHHGVLLDVSDRESPEYITFWDTLRAGNHVTGRYRRVGKDGRVLWLQASYNPVFDLNGKLWKIVKFATDVTADVAMAEAFEDAKRQAQHDPATSLPNRTRLTSFMTAALESPGARLAVLYLDLDQFKPINDNFGHHVGDRVLGEIADRLRRALAGDQMVARVGGDEFVIAAPHLGEEQLDSFCQRLIETVNLPIRHESGEVRVGLSIGVAMSPADGSTPDELLRAADAALYRAKRDGGGGYRFFATEANERALANRRLTDAMRHGIERGEFFLEFQPRYEASSQAIRSAEALVRWAHPQLGRIGPDRFIPLAERNGLIIALGNWVLQEACRAVARWPGLGISVNVSPAQFRDGHLAERIRRTLAETGVAPERLEIEITEGVLIEDAERAARTLQEIKAIGVRLAMDDFGTGYSSLSNLRQFPFDVIKIDRQFISDIEQRRGSRDIVKAILALGKALGLTVTAEGVETVGQLRMLIEDQCSEVQGFLLSRPIAAPDLDVLLGRDLD